MRQCDNVMEQSVLMNEDARGLQATVHQVSYGEPLSARLTSTKRQSISPRPCNTLEKPRADQLEHPIPPPSPQLLSNFDKVQHGLVGGLDVSSGDNDRCPTPTFMSAKEDSTSAPGGLPDVVAYDFQAKLAGLINEIALRER
jgi:hypothetical protein